MALTEPTFMVIVGGVDVSQNFRSRMVIMRVSDSLNDEADRVQIVLDDTDGTLAIPERGAWISIALGWDGQMVPMGQYEVESVFLEGGGEKPWTMTVIGISAGLGLASDTPAGVRSAQ
jgi:uncharacterized protein